MRIRKSTQDDLQLVAKLALELWPDNSMNAISAEFMQLLQSSDAAVFLAFLDGKAVGFAECKLRADYVEGTDTSPVGYLEGIYVCEAYRMRGIAKQLLSACESWVKECGCKEFASDCELTNEESLRFHLKVGFTEANRVICFTKQL